jgi:hypothetical protein
MTPQQVILKHLQRMLPKVEEAIETLVQVEEVIELVKALETVQPLDSILSEEYQTFNDQTKKAEWVAESIAHLENLYRDNDSIYTRPN